jgi:octaheme c-type cytochrome (tetrathionate reductase family)
MKNRTLFTKSLTFGCVLCGLSFGFVSLFAEDVPVKDMIEKVAMQEHAQDQKSPSATTADHSKFEILQQEFKTGPEVTKACLTCHTEASKQIHQTIHWTWFNGDINIGKKNVANNFCIAVPSNEPRCTSCHVGYGWKDNTFDFTDETAVDCLICHDGTGKYKKFPTDAGHPNYVEKEWPKGSGKMRPVANLTEIAQKVQKASRENCGACHFYGGGGDGVKHGHLDSSLKNPDKALDVHMDAKGLNFNCTTCHTTWGHNVAGSKYQLKAVDLKGQDLPRGDGDRSSCVSCHGTSPMKNAKLNDHVDKIACETCHIPEFARGGVPTKMWWDWSTAYTKKDETGKLINVQKNEKGQVIYDAKKGDFQLEENVVPTYMWFDGNMKYKAITDKIVKGETPAILTEHNGRADDPNSRIWPMKVMRGFVPYDVKNQVLALPHLFPSKGKEDQTAFWKKHDWASAIQEGMMAAGSFYETIEGFSFSGEMDWIETEMYWPQTHMVAPKEDALQCDDCHAREGRLAAIDGIYIPGRDHIKTLDMAGWAFSALALIGILLHGIRRMFS